MGIDKIGPLNNYNSYNKINKKNSVEKSDSSYSINISKEAMDMAENNKIIEIVKSAPDVRIDKINEIKAKINNPEYIDEAITGTVAEEIMNLLT